MAMTMRQAMEDLRVKCARAAATVGGDGLPRVVGDSTVDYSKADKGCAVCGGTGVAYSVEISQERKGFRPRKLKIPVVCSCVVAGGGVPVQPVVQDRGVLPGGYSTKGGVYVCSECGATSDRVPIVDGVPVVPDGWGREGRRTLCPKCVVSEDRPS